LLQCAADDNASQLYEADRCVVAVEVAANPRKPIGARGVIYNVPLDIPTDDILACLAGQGVQSVRRFRYKGKDSLR